MRGDADPTWWTWSSALGNPDANDMLRHYRALRRGALPLDDAATGLELDVDRHEPLGLERQLDTVLLGAEVARGALVEPRGGADDADQRDLRAVVALSPEDDRP